MTRTVVWLVLCTVLLQACYFNNSGSWKNEHIEKSKRLEIKDLNTKLYKALFSNDLAGVTALFSDTLRKATASTMPELMSTVSAFKPENYRTGDEYYSRNSATGISNTIPSDPADSNGYVINYLALNKEMYVSQLMVQQKNSALLVLLVYGKYENGWKLNILNIGQYSLDGLTAPQYYEQAKASYERSWLIDAVNEAKLAERCLEPGGIHLHYKIEKQARYFLEKVRAEANQKWTLPYKLESIPTSPEILTINPEVTEAGASAIVHYLSSINVTDTVALKAEYEKIKPAVRYLFPGIDNNKKALLYRAYNEIPDGRKRVEWYTFVELLPAKPI